MFRRRGDAGPSTRPLALAFALTALVGCKTGTGGEGSADPDTAAQGAPAGVKLPEPLPLPDDPATVMHVADVAATARSLERWFPGRVEPKRWLGLELQRFIEPEVAKALAESIDPAGAWDAVEFGDAAIFHLPVVPAALPALQKQLASMPTQGKFGAVRLASRDERPVLAWARETTEGPRLTLARSEPGLVAGVDLAKRYGEAPLVATADIERLHLAVDLTQVPFTQVSARGDLEDLELRLQVAEGKDPLAEMGLGAGAMAELLRDPRTLVGASARYEDYKKAVSRVISQLQVQIDELPFLLKGYATDISARFNAILRSWDGRFMAGYAEGHLRVAYGAEDAKKSGVAVLHFLRGALDGLSLVGSFSKDVPDIRLKKNVATAREIEIHRLDVRGARKMVGPLTGLLDENAALHLAMAFDPRLGGGAMVAGPRAEEALRDWIDAAEEPVATIEQAPVAAMHVALSASQLETLGQAARGGELPLEELWGWKAEGPPVDIELRRDTDGAWVARVRSPKAPESMQLALPKGANP